MPTQITESEIYSVCHGAYIDDYPFDHIFQGEKDDQAYFAVKYVGDIDVVVARGSTTVLDWLRNFEVIPEILPNEGWVDSGFEIGVLEAMENVKPVLRGKGWIGTGHSRGAAQMTDFAVRAKLDGWGPMALVLFAPPRTGGGKQRLILADTPTHAYVNMADPPDPVPNVPPWCSHPYSLIPINEPAPSDDAWGPIRSHHDYLYGQGVAKLSPMPFFRLP